MPAKRILACEPDGPVRTNGPQRPFCFGGDHFEAFKAALSTPASWCEFLPLNFNVKACTFQMQAHDAPLTLYLGRNYSQSPRDASS